MKTYTERMLMLLAEQEPISILETTAMKLELFLYGLSESDFERSYAQGKWSAKEILAHLADVELLYGYRFRQTIAEEDFVIQTMNQENWAKRYAKLEPSLALDAFRALRAWNLSLLSTFDLQDWLKEARHPERGIEDVDLMLRLWAAHDLNHLAQLDLIMHNKEPNK